MNVTPGLSFCGDYVFLRAEGNPGSTSVSKCGDGKGSGRVPGGEMVRCAGDFAFISIE